jgi:glycosyltransferase involved in cell wall biosynthesis
VGNLAVEPGGTEAGAVEAEAGTRSFPTLAEELRDRPSHAPAATSSLVVLVERACDLELLRNVVPAGSFMVAGSTDEVETTPGRRTEAEVAPAARTVEDVLDILRQHKGDLLVVADPTPLTPAGLDALRTALSADSACATVSLDDNMRSSPPGVPAPGLLTPRPGVVLVGRDHARLALEEAPLVGSGERSPTSGDGSAGVVTKVLAILDRPGFVHRGVGVEPRAATVTPPRAAASRASPMPRVVLDGRCLAQPLSGTQVQVLGLVGGLLRAGANVALLRPSELHPTVLPEVERLGDDVPFVELDGVGRPDVFHRAFQVRSLHELADCLSIGERLVLTHQDMIVDRTRAYVKSDAAWQDYRRTTAAALSSADEVGFFSRHAALDAASEGALDLDRATVVTLGVDHVSHTFVDDSAPHPLGGRPYVLVVGNAYWHKNRLFAVRLVRSLVERHGWDGGLVLAGRDPGRGSSRPAEQAVLDSDPAFRSRVLDLGYVPAASQGALYRSAELVLFPSLYEGFGLIPFEAASLGTACAYTHRASMRELLPVVGALPSFDVEEAGSFVFRLLESGPARERVVAGITEAARDLTWDRTAAGYLDVYRRALEREPRTVSRLLLSVAPKASRVTAREAVVIDVYRRRRVFRLAVDGVLRAGAVGLRVARRVGSEKK